VAGDNLVEGAYQVLSRQSENTLEVHVPAPPKPAAPAPGAAAAPAPAAPPPVPAEALGPPALHLARYLTLDPQKWTIAPVAGGYAKIVNLGTGDAIGATAAAVELGAYAGTDAQLWRLEQFPDGGYRILNKATGLSLAAGSAKDPNGVVVGPFVRDDLHLWTITTP